MTGAALASSTSASIESTRVKEDNGKSGHCSAVSGMIPEPKKGRSCAAEIEPSSFLCSVGVRGFLAGVRGFERPALASRSQHATASSIFRQVSSVRPERSRPRRPSSRSPASRCRSIARSSAWAGAGSDGCAGAVTSSSSSAGAASTGWSRRRRARRPRSASARGCAAIRCAPASCWCTKPRRGIRTKPTGQTRALEAESAIRPWGTRAVAAGGLDAARRLAAEAAGAGRSAKDAN